MRLGAVGKSDWLCERFCNQIAVRYRKEPVHSRKTAIPGYLA